MTAGGTFALSNDRDAFPNPGAFVGSRRDVKKRLGDRRSRPRFDIVGNLVGQVDAWQSLEVINLGPGGALVETALPLAPGIRLDARVSMAGGRYQLRGQVNHSRPIDQESRYRVGLEWIDGTPPGDELAAAAAAAGGELAPEPEGSRRRFPRFPRPPGWDVALRMTSSATIIDISGGGVLFASKVRFDTGDRAQLRLRLGDEDFASEIEIRRTVPPQRGNWRTGAAFVSLDALSRRNLEHLLLLTH